MFSSITKPQTRYTLFFTLTLLAACGGGSGSTKPLVQNTCQSPLLKQLCGTTWVSGCVSQSTDYTVLTSTFYKDETFNFIGQKYSDVSCTTATTNLAFSGKIIEGTDITLIDGTVGKRVKLSVTKYNGNIVKPANIQYTIIQISTTDSNILYMGDTDNTAALRDSKMRIRPSIPYAKQ